MESAKLNKATPINILKEAVIRLYQKEGRNREDAEETLKEKITQNSDRHLKAQKRLLIKLIEN